MRAILLEELRVELETRTMRRVTKRLLPLLILCYFVAFLDRVNIGFASLTMNKDLGITSTVYGQAAGVFFISYFLLEVPSNLALVRFGASKWIARIMVTWGIVSGCMAFATGEWSFLGLRFLLGAAEAGFFPGVIFYLTLWFPAAYRGRIIGLFMAAVPLSGVFGAPVSAYLLQLDGAMGLHGWQWMFIMEAVPAVLLSVVVLALLTDRPSVAKWLPRDEREWLQNALREEARRNVMVEEGALRALLNPIVLAFSLVYFGNVACLYGVSFFLPQIVKQFGLTTTETGWVAAIPFVVGACGAVLWGRSSDARSERKAHLLISLALASGGIAVSTFLPSPVLKMAALSVSAFGVYGALPVFWTFPTAFLSGAAAASGIAMINALGNISGYYGPAVVGYLKDHTGSYEPGLQVLAGLGFLAFLVVLVVARNPGRMQVAALVEEATAAE